VVLDCRRDINSIGSVESDVRMDTLRLVVNVKLTN